MTNDFEVALKDMARLSWQQPDGSWEHVSQDDFISFFAAHYETIRTALQKTQKIESGGVDMMIDDTIGALKAIREEVGNGLRLSTRSQNLGYQALDQLMAFKQFGTLPSAPNAEETKG